MIGRVLILALALWDMATRTRSRATVRPRVRMRPMARARPRPRPEPETIDDLVIAVPAQATTPRVLGYALIVPGLGAVAVAGSCIPLAGRDGIGVAMVGLSHAAPRAHRLCAAIDDGDGLVLPSEDVARALLWSLRGRVPTTVEILPVIVEAP